MTLLDFASAPHGGSQRHLPEWQSQPRITPTTIIDHSIVGSAEGAFQMFRDRSVLESHFIVGLTGEIWQLMDTSRQADANLDANDFAISIETADLGDPDNQPWTQAQLDSLIWLHEALLAAHPTIPRQRCPTWNGGGLGYHTLFGAPSHWTPVAKTCPGRVRKAQWTAVLLPAFLQPAKEEPDVTEEQARQLKAIYDGLIVPGTTTPDQTVNLLFARVRTIEAAIQRLVLGSTSGDLEVTGLLHVEAPVPPPPAETVNELP